MELALQKLKKIETVIDKEGEPTMAQAAIKFCLAQPTIVSVLPNFTNLEELREYTAAPDAPDLTDGELAQLDELWQHGFDLEDPAPQFREI